MNRPQVIYGTGLWGQYEDSPVSTGETAQQFIDALHKRNYLRIDTARRYPAWNSGTSEKVLGECDLRDFTIDTKVWSTPGKHRLPELEKSINESLGALGITKINILFLHFPDTETPLEEMLQAITSLYNKTGKFNKFGVSNYTIAQMKEIFALCEANGYLKPTYYQGQYNAIARDAEEELLPLLREHGVNFIAYSPAAGGAFNKDSKAMANQGHQGEIWRKQYGYKKATQAIEHVREAADKHGLPIHEVALRWTLYHSALKGGGEDAIVITARTVDRLQSALDMCEAGPLPDDLVSLLEHVWMTIRDDAPRYSLIVPGRNAKD